MNDLLDNNKSCPYYQLINIFKYYIQQNNNTNKNGKYSSITNHNQDIINNNNLLNSKLNLFSQEKSFYYYDPFPSLQSPILLIALISFHHKKGSIIEYSFPPKESLHESPNISYLIKNKNISIEKFVDNLFQKLTYICLPDGIHCTKSDTQFFIIQDYNYPLYGISCYEQIKSERDDTIENTRHFIQKSLCILSILPLYSPLYAKLSATIETFFNQSSLKDKNIINDLYQNFFLDGETNFRLDEMNFVFSTRKLLCFTHEKIFLILKMILLEKKILIFSNISGNVCSFLYNLLAIIPGQILFNLKNGKDIKNYLKHLKFFGLPLKIFHEKYKIYPLVSLYEIDQIEQEKNVNYIMGTTNQLIWNESFDNKKVDLMINIDKMEIIPFYKNENKYIFELTKEEKEIYDIIENKLIDKNVNYNSTSWLNSNEIDDECDEFIRNEFTKYFKDMLIKLSLIYNIINKNNIVRLLNFLKLDDIYSQSILDEKAIKYVIKQIVASQEYISFLYLFSQTKSFIYWLSDVSENLFYLSPYITSDKSITIILEDGNTYIGSLDKGLFDGFGTLSSPDNKAWQRPINYRKNKI